MRDAWGEGAKVLCPGTGPFSVVFKSLDHVLLACPIHPIAVMSQPNKTLYIKNLNDQVKKDGEARVAFPQLKNLRVVGGARTQVPVVRALHALWPDSRCRCY
jgi:hypothetical protein